MMALQEIFVMVLSVVVAVYGFMICAYTAGLVRLLKSPRAQAIPFTGFVSVVLAVRNEEHNILEILEELRSQDYPADRMEVLLADDYSEDATMALAGRYAASHPGFPLVLVPSGEPGENSPGKKRAIERAVARAAGEILLFTDADTSRGSGWIFSMVMGFAAPGIQMVLGPVVFCKERNLLQKVQALEFMGLMGTTAGSAALGYPVMCNGANLAYRSEAFQRTGGFSENHRYASGDDQFMMSAIRKQYGKGSLMFNADPVSQVRTEPEPTFHGFLNQRLRWVSKSKGYRDPVVLFVGVLTYLANMLLLAGLVAGIFLPVLFVFTAAVWLGKILVEYPMVWVMSGFFGKRHLTGYYFIAQVFQLLYVPVTGLLGLLLPYRWKGRKG